MIYILTKFKACAEKGLAHVVLFKLESPAWKETTFFKTRLELFFLYIINLIYNLYPSFDGCNLSFKAYSLTRIVLCNYWK